MFFQQLVRIISWLPRNALIDEKSDIMSTLLQRFRKTSDCMLTTTTNTDGRKNPSNIQLRFINFLRRNIRLSDKVSFDDILHRCHNINRALRNNALRCVRTPQLTFHKRKAPLKSDLDSVVSKVLEKNADISHFWFPLIIFFSLRPGAVIVLPILQELDFSITSIRFSITSIRLRKISF